MVLPLPVRFDANEWFVILNSLLGYAWIFFVKPRYPRSVSVLVVLFCVSAAIMMDHAIASPPLNWYDINDLPTYELMDVFTYFMFAPYALLCVYIYDKLDPKGLWYTAYIVGWSLLCVGYEWLAIKFHVFAFQKWSLVYSFSVYLVMTTILLQFFRYLLRHVHDRPESFRPTQTSH